MPLNSVEKLHFFRVIKFPIILICILWMVHFLEIYYNVSLENWGIYPKTCEGLRGILLSPLVHADMNHLISNSIPLLILTVSIVYFYSGISFKIIALLWFTTGLCVWIGGREAYHIGSSGLIYGEASFLFFSGIFRKNIRLSAISLLVVFLYGGLIWGIFPVYPDISWESHLFGGISGLTFAIILRDEGPVNEQKKWEDEDDQDEDWYADDCLSDEDI